MIVTLIGFFYGGGSRKSAFNETWMNKNFLKQHQEAFGAESQPSKEGYPDTGNGIYSKQLSYKQWYEFNLNQRCHMNCMETVLQQMLFMLVAGVHYPKVSYILGGIACAGRVFYAYGYARDPKLRMPGFILTMGSMMSSFFVSLASIY